MKRISLIAAAVAAGLLLTGCLDEPKTVKSEQAKKAEAAANSINFSENAEIDNIKRRLELTANPGLMGYVVLLNEAGQPIMYTAVKGKITSGGKRLTAPDKVGGTLERPLSRPGPSDEGTYGNSGEYVFFWTINDQYIQWNGRYLYSDKPFRLSVQPLVVEVKSGN